MSIYEHSVLQVDAAEDDFLGFSLSIIVIFGLSFLAASFILYPVAEKASKVIPPLLYCSVIVITIIYTTGQTHSICQWSPHH